MRALTLEYNFFRGGAAAKLIVRAAENVMVTAVVGNRVYHTLFSEKIEVSADGIRAENHVFKTDKIVCDLKLQGLTVICNAEICAVTAFKRPLGLLCEIGVSSYTLGSPAVSATVSGHVRFGNLNFETGAYAVLYTAKGCVENYYHTVITAAGTQGSMFLTFGENASFGKTWNYALACVATPTHVYLFTGTAKLATMTETSDTVHAVLSSPASKLDLTLIVDNECEDNKYRFSVSAVSKIIISASHRVVETLSMPSTFVHRGKIKIKNADEEVLREKTQSESGTVINEKLNR